MQPERIDFSKNHIVGKSGKKYYFNNSIPVARYQMYEELEMKITYGRSHADVFASHKKVHDLLNEGKFIDAGIENYNTMTGINEAWQKRYHPVLLMCTLFINEKEEDITQYDENLAKDKIEDWSIFAVNDFFQFAFNLVPDFLENSKEISLNYLQEEKQKQSTSDKGKLKTKETGQKCSQRSPKQA